MREAAATPWEWELDASRLGMWVFLASEALFFGALFTAFMTYRWWHAEAFAEAAKHMKVGLGTLNTAVLLTSSASMALGVHAAQERRLGASTLWLAVTAALGAAFLSIKGLEYAAHVRDGLWPGPGFAWPGDPSLAGGARLFFSLYFCMTGLHALHMIAGLGAVGVAALRASFGVDEAKAASHVENTGLYWHFVDVVWIWLYPAFYLLTKTR